MKRVKKKKPVEEETEYDDDDEEVEEEPEEEEATEVIDARHTVLGDVQEQPKPAAATGNWTVGEVATKTQPVIYNGKSQERHTTETALAEILNKLERIERSVVG